MSRGSGVLPGPDRQPCPPRRDRSGGVGCLGVAVFEDLGQGVQERQLALVHFVRAASIVHQAALSTSGYWWTCPEPGGHSSSKVLLTACVASKSDSITHALILLRLGGPNSPRKILVPSGGGDPNSSSNSRRATVSASSPSTYSPLGSTRRGHPCGPRTARRGAPAALRPHRRRSVGEVSGRRFSCLP